MEMNLSQSNYFAILLVHAIATNKDLLQKRTSFELCRKTNFFVNFYLLLPK